MYQNGAHCYKSVTVQYNGKKVKATVTDEVCLEIGCLGFTSIDCALLVVPRMQR